MKLAQNAKINKNIHKCIKRVDMANVSPLEQGSPNLLA